MHSWHRRSLTERRVDFEVVYWSLQDIQLLKIKIDNTYGCFLTPLNRKAATLPADVQPPSDTVGTIIYYNLYSYLNLNKYIKSLQIQVGF